MIRLVFRVAALLLWTLLCAPVQLLLLCLPGRGPEHLALLYWRGIRRIMGVRITVHGRLTAQRPVLFVANHCTWLDIVVLGSLLPGCFVAKAAITGWPGINIIAYLGRTVFVSRTRAQVGAERNSLGEALAKGKNLILFPEGTTSDGTRVLSFSSTFLSLAEGPDALSVQPVTLVYDRLEGVRVRRRDRQVISWYGDMDLLPHALKVLRFGRLHVSLVLHESIPPGALGGRKPLAAALQAMLAQQAAILRQHRKEESSFF
jgi:1-acyl-sn-glycerol-3-phosphate acyltransferase